MESVAFTVDVDGRHAVLLSREEYNKVISDESYKEKILQNLRAVLGTADNQVSSEKENEVEVSRASVVPIALTAPKWNHEAILHLIEEYRREKGKHVMVKDIWNAISRSLTTKGYDITPADCDKKWRNLKCTYKRCKEIKERTGRGPQKWTYYDLFDEIYRESKDASPQDVMNTLVASLCSVEDSDSYNNPSTSKQTDAESSSSESHINEGDDEATNGDGSLMKKIKRIKDYQVLGPRWSHDTIIQLIEEFRKEKGKHEKVKDIWSAISKSLSDKGYDISAAECDKKWRNLKITYKKIKEFKGRPGMPPHKWLYFDLFDQIFQDQTDSLENGISNLYSPKWSHETILLLIEEYRKEKDNHRMVKSVWTAVSKSLAAKGLDVTPGECDKKWRNLKSTYLKIKEMKMKTGRGPVKWPYFEVFEELFPDIPCDSTENTTSVLEIFLAGSEEFSAEINNPSTSKQIGGVDLENSVLETSAANRSLLKRKQEQLPPPPWWRKVEEEQLKLAAERDEKLLTEMRLLRETIARTFGATNAILKEILKKL